MRSPLPFLLAILFLDAVGIGLVYPVMPDLIGQTERGTIENAALWSGALSAVYALMQFHFAPMIGVLLDRFGRHPVLLVSLGAMALDYLGSALAGSMAILLTLHLVAGIAAVTHGTCNAAAVDATPPDRRAQAFGLLRAAFMDGFILGPVTGSLLGESGPRAPFWAAAALAGANLVFGWFALPEAVTDETRRSFKPARVNPLGALRSVSRLSGAAPLLAIIFLT